MARVTQEEMDRRIAAAGGTTLTHSPTASKKKIPNPAHKVNGGTSYTVPEEIEIEVQRWKGPGTGGAEIEAYQLPDGSWEIEKESPAAAPAATATTGKPVGSTTQIEGTPLPGGGFDNSRPVMVTRGPDGTMISSEPLTPAERQQWEREKNPGGKTDAEIASPDAADAVGKPTGNTDEITRDGKKIKRVEYVLPDGKKEWREQTTAGEGPTSSTATEPLKGQPGWQVGKRAATDANGNSISETYYIDPQGNETKTPPPDRGTGSRIQKRDKAGNVYYEVKTEKDGQTELTYENEQGEKIPPPSDSAMAGVKGVPSYTPDLTKPGAGLIDRAKQLDELMAAGTITWDQRQEILKNDQVLANSIANEFNVGVAILREDYQNQTSQRNADVSTANTRLSISNQHMQNALGFVGKFMPYLGQTEGDAGRLFTGLLATQVAHATALGGLKDVPREQMHPNLMGAAERMTAGAAGRPATPTMPNAIGAGAVPESVTPGVPTLPSAALPEPIFRPQPEATLPPSPVSQVNPALQSALGLTPPPQPEDNSWRQQALNRSDIGLGENLLGASPFQIEQPAVDDGSGFAPLPMVLDSSVPGLTPELDLQARKELDMALAGGRY